MSQVFPPSADTWLRLFLLAALGAVAILVLAAGGYVRSDYATGLDWTLDQPVPFSHEHHVSGLGIDCRYCHSSVEVSAEAGFPPTDTCMTCHSHVWTGADMLEPVRRSLATGKPMRWRRVARLPGFVYFHHDVHLAAGVGCATCHGRVDRMPLMRRAEPFQMRWCLECHRDPAPHLRPREFVTDMTWRTDQDRRVLGRRLMTEYGIEPEKLTHCYVCHR